STACPGSTPAPAVGASTTSRRGLRQIALGGALVVAESEEDRLAELPVGRPLGVRDLRDELRLEPRESAPPRRIGERRRAAHERAEALPQRLETLLGEAGADLADVEQRAVTTAAEQQRAEAAARASGLGE